MVKRGYHLKNQLITYDTPDLKRHFEQSWPAFFFLLLLLFFPLVGLYSRDGKYFNFYLNGAIFFATIIFLPTIFIHYKYWLFSRDLKITINILNKSFTYEREGKLKTINFSNINRIETIISRAQYNDTLHIFPWDSYSYSTLFLESGDTLVVTSLSIPNLQWPFDLPNEEVYDDFFCIPK